MNETTMICTPKSRQNPSTAGSERESLWQDNNDLVEIYGDVALIAHSSDSNMSLASDRAAQLADLERKLLHFFKETDDDDNIPLIEGFIADTQSVACDILTTGRPLI